MSDRGQERMQVTRGLQRVQQQHRALNPSVACTKSVQKRWPEAQKHCCNEAAFVSMDTHRKLGRRMSTVARCSRRRSPPLSLPTLHDSCVADECQTFKIF